MHVVGRRMAATGDDPSRKYVQTPEEGVDRLLAARAMQQALGEIRRACARYLRTGRTSDDNRLTDMKGTVVLKLRVPATWNFALTAPLTEAMHGAVVDYCAGRLLQASLPEEAAAFAGSAQSRLRDIKGLLEKRTAPVRRPISPF